MVAEVFHPDGGSARIPGNPIRLSETPAGTYTPPPLIGQHTAEILRALLSIEDAAIISLRDSGVI
jgi:formyl-CoA transferase